MKIQERHEEVAKIFKDLQSFYEKHFPPGRNLTDEEWQEYIDGVWRIAERYKGTNLEDLAGELAMALSNDIERIDKAWRRRNEVQKTEQE